VQRRVDILAAEGIDFITNAHIGQEVGPVGSCSPSPRQRVPCNSRDEGPQCVG